MYYNHSLLPGAIARSVAMSLGNQEAPRSILASGTSFREDLVMKIFLRPFFRSLIQEEHLSVIMANSDVRLVLVTCLWEACPGTVWIG